MTEKEPLAKKKLSVDWLFRGVLTKVGDTFDRFTGRRWTPSSSLAASELIDRMKKLLDAEAKMVPGKGLVVPHNIKLRMQWDKFSEDAEAGLKKLKFELLTAAIDHINDSLYYTLAPVKLEVKTDYFTEGVKLTAGFDELSDEERDLELNVTIPSIDVSKLVPAAAAAPVVAETYLARFELNGVPKEKSIDFPSGTSVSVGRTGTNALVIEDASVSKIHASLSVNPEGRLFVADTGSTNGTFINDIRIAYGKATAVEDTDKVKFGTVEVGFTHVPRPVVIEQEVPAEDEAPKHDTFEIGGFEFRSGSTPDVPEATMPAIPEPVVTPAAAAAEQPAATPEPPLAAIPVPSQTLRIDPISPIERPKVNHTPVELKPVGRPSDEPDDEPETRFK